MYERKKQCTNVYATKKKMIEQELGSMIVGQFSGVVCVQFTTVILTIIWFAVIAICMWGYFIITAGDAKVDENGNVYYDYNPNGWVIFGLVVSLYWSIEVNSNISHTTGTPILCVFCMQNLTLSCMMYD